MLAQYEKDGVFLPRNLKMTILTIIGKDNVDHNASSTTATKHYHGTSLSVFQFPTTQNPGIPFGPLEVTENTTKSNSKKIENLPSSYTCIKYFLSPSVIIFPPDSNVVISSHCGDEIYFEGDKEERKWLENAQVISSSM